jgi:hypothetical protein
MRALAVAVAVSVGLVALYLALGGASYEPAKAANPCATRDWRNPGGFQEVAEQIVLSALDGTACKLHVSREDLVLALANSGSLDRFAREHGITNREAEELVRSGLLRAVDDAQRAGAVGETTAGLLRLLARNVPVDELLDLLQRLQGF